MSFLQTTNIPSKIMRSGAVAATNFEL